MQNPMSDMRFLDAALASVVWIRSTNLGLAGTAFVLTKIWQATQNNHYLQAIHEINQYLLEAATL